MSAVATAPSATRAALDVEIVAVEPIVLDLPAKAVFMLAGGVMAHPGAPAPRVLTRVTGTNGVVGWGESTPSPTWSYETVETIYWTIKRYPAPVATSPIRRSGSRANWRDWESMRSSNRCQPTTSAGCAA